MNIPELRSAGPLGGTTTQAWGAVAPPSPGPEGGEEKAPAGWGGTGGAGRRRDHLPRAPKKLPVCFELGFCRLHPATPWCSTSYAPEHSPGWGGDRRRDAPGVHSDTAPRSPRRCRLCPACQGPRGATRPSPARARVGPGPRRRVSTHAEAPPDSCGPRPSTRRPKPHAAARCCANAGRGAGGAGRVQRPGRRTGTVVRDDVPKRSATGGWFDPQRLPCPRPFRPSRRMATARPPPAGAAGLWQERGWRTHGQKTDFLDRSVPSLRQRISLSLSLKGARPKA